MKAFLIVLDSVGIGAAPDAADYDDVGSNTLAHIGQTVGALKLPTLQALGLGNIPPHLPGGCPIPGIAPVTPATGGFGAMQEQSRGKDTTTGHWEIAGLLMEKGFHLFPHQFPSFPPHLIQEFEQRTGRKTIGNKAANGIAIINELGKQQMDEGAWIVYTSGDSVFQIAAHEAIIPLPELYEGCRIARELCDPYIVGRVIARPYIGQPGTFKRTENRRDFSYPLPEPTLLDRLFQQGLTVITVGKLDDIFCNRGITRSCHVENNPDAENTLLKLADQTDSFFCFANLIDFDMLYGHRRDAIGYAGALERTDRFLSAFLAKLAPTDLVIISADHGNDPTFKGSDHTREYVPLLTHGPGQTNKHLGIRNGFYDVAQTIAQYFGIPAMPRGISFL
jgi:phosphopentomutase